MSKIRVTMAAAASAMAAVLCCTLAVSAAPAMAALPVDPTGGTATGQFDPPTAISPADVLSVTGAAGGTQTVVFAAQDSSLVTVGAVLDVAPGSADPHGLLVTVVSVTSNGTTVTAVTSPAGINKALPPGTYTKDLTVPAPPGATPSSSGVSTGPIPWSIPISKVVQCSGTVTANISGSLTINPSATVQLDVDGQGLHSASLSLSMTEDAALKASVSAAANCTANVSVIKDMPLPGIPIGPIYIEPTFSVTVDALLNATASASISGTEHFDGTVGVSYDQTAGLQSLNQAHSNVHMDKPQLSGTAKLEGGVTASLALMIEGVAGPRVDARGYLGVSADSNAIPWWTLYGGIKVSGGIQVLIFNVGSLTIWAQQWPLLSALGLVGSALPTALPGSAYSQTVKAVGGVGPYLYNVSSGSLPAGLSMSANGVISGVPTPSTSTQTGSFVVTATDSTGSSTSATYSITVPGFGIAGTASLPAASIGSAYSTTLLAIGAVGTPTWRISSGSLPSGLSLASNGVISGTPATNATAGSFAVTLSDSTGRTVTKAFTLAVTRVTLPTCGLKGCPI